MNYNDTSSVRINHISQGEWRDQDGGVRGHGVNLPHEHTENSFTCGTILTVK